MTEPARSSAAVASATTALFVPGDRPERFAKALAAGAGLVILDLEDAVAAEAKDRALDAVLAELGRPGAPVAVRVDGGAGLRTRQLRALAGAAVPGRLAAVMLPKAEDPATIATARREIAGRVVWIPLIETARGVLAAPELARVPGVARLAFGAIDLALDLDAEDEGLDAARSAVVLASRASDLAGPLASPSPEIRDLGKVGEAAARARRFGFAGSLCIHPAQVPVVRAAFLPTEGDIARARTVLAGPDGARQADGRMVDRPVLERARRVLAAAGESE